MKLIWLGHSGFRLEIADQVLLIDPWLAGNPMFQGHDEAAALTGATAIFLTHGHGDHASNAIAISKDLDIPIYAIHELATYWAGPAGAKAVGYSKGGTVTLGGVQVTLVNATHSSSVEVKDGPIMYAGGEAGLMIAGEGHTIYVSGDTDIMADMEWMGDYHKPDIGILAAGGHYTMDMKRAAYAARRYFDFKVVIPCHYRTFPLLAQSAQDLIDGLPGVAVIEPQVMQPIEL